MMNAKSYLLMRGVISIDEVAGELQIEKAYVIENLDNWRMPYHKIGDLILFSEKEFMSWLNNKDGNQ
jgi:excisionase family DNA binding protein